MKLFLLAGNSSHNKAWIEEVAEAMRTDFEETRIHYYRHWETGEEFVDLEYEIEAVLQDVGDLAGWSVFAKSAGTLLILKGVKEGKLKPAKCVFAGTAVAAGRAREVAVEAWLENYRVPTLFIQKTTDPACSFAELKQLLADNHVKGYEMLELPGDDHHYGDVSRLREATIAFCLTA